MALILGQEGVNYVDHLRILSQTFELPIIALEIFQEFSLKEHLYEDDKLYCITDES